MINWQKLDWLRVMRVGDMSGENRVSLSGKDRVREYFIHPMEQAGFVRKRGVSVDDHNKFLKRLERRLAYLDVIHLKGLFEFSVELGRGILKNVWPVEQTLVHAAHRLQKPPPQTDDYVISVIKSQMGIDAQAGGYLVELFQIARRTGPPPTKYFLRKLSEEAVENRRREEIVLRNRSLGRAHPDELAWLTAYQLDREMAENILKQKQVEAVV
jgi:hypothetical protein